VLRELLVKPFEDPADAWLISDNAVMTYRNVNKDLLISMDSLASFPSVPV